MYEVRLEHLVREPNKLADAAKCTSIYTRERRCMMSHRYPCQRLGRLVTLRARSCVRWHRATHGNAPLAPVPSQEFAPTIHVLMDWMQLRLRRWGAVRSWCNGLLPPVEAHEMAESRKFLESRKLREVALRALAIVSLTMS